jgi:lysophospholipase L1-like esterase
MKNSSQSAQILSRVLGFVLGCLVTTTIVHAQIATPALPPQDWPNLQRYAIANRDLKALPQVAGRVVFMGDSITEGWGRAPVSIFQNPLYVNRGISGQTTSQMLLRFRPDVLDLHPDTVVILGGTNDIAGNTGPATLESIEGNIASMAELANAHKIRVIISSVLPAADYSWRPGKEPAPKIRIINHWLQEYCTQHDFTYLDYYTSLATPEGGMRPEYSKDGVHPTPAGYEIMNALVQKVLTP